MGNSSSDGELRQQISSLQNALNHTQAAVTKAQQDTERVRVEAQREREEAQERHKQQMRQSFIQQQATLQSQLHDKTIEYNQVHQQLIDLQNQISEEEKTLITDFDDEKDDPNSKIIILLGNTGDGKSTFGNRLVGDRSLMANEGPFRTSNECESCTQHLSKHKVELDDDEITMTVVDAPGFNDSQGKDRFVYHDLYSLFEVS